MKTPLYIVLLLILITARACTNDHQQPQRTEPTIDLVPLDTVKIQGSDLLLNRVSDVVIANREETLLALINEDTNEIIVFDTEGKHINTIGQAGTGPEDIGRVSAIGFHENENIILYDGAQDFIKKFNLSGDLVDLAPGILEDGMWIRAPRIFTRDSHIYLGIEEARDSGDDFWTSPTVAQLDLEGELVEQYGTYDPALEETGRFYKYANILLDESEIYTTHRTLPYIQVLDYRTGESKGRFGIQSGSFLTSDEQIHLSDSREVRNQKNLERSFVGNSFASENYFYFYFFNFTEQYWEDSHPNSKQHFFMIYEKDDPWEAVGEIRLPYLPLHVSRNDVVYLLKNDDPDNFTVATHQIMINQEHATFDL